MKPKKTVVFPIILVFLLLAVTIGVLGVRSHVRSLTSRYLASKGYDEDDIAEVGMDYSFLNAIFGYDSWKIDVTLRKEPAIVFDLTCKNQEILFRSASRTPHLSKEERLSYETAFLNGELKSEKP